MRKDMSKIIVERPRLGSGWERKGRSRSLVDEDGAPLRARDRDDVGERSRKTKRLNENLAPLRRFLESNVGRPWNKVHSELAEHIRPTSTVQQHVLDHVSDFVATNTAMKDGEVVVTLRYTRKAEPVKQSWAYLYVHPRTGLLLKNRNWRTPPGRTSQPSPKARRHELGPFRQAHFLADGAWWDVVLEPNPTRTETIRVTGRGVSTRKVPLAFEDVVLARGLSKKSAESLYGRAGVHAVSARKLTKAERKRLGLS
jgi:hypothetical protein